MNKRRICSVALLGTGLVAGPLFAESIEDQVLAKYGMFRLERAGGTAVTGGSGANIKSYRICMDDVQKAVPLKVMHDGQTTIVKPGECQLVDAKTLALASADKLHRGMTLIGITQQVAE